MDPRSLVGPTLIVLAVIIAAVCSLFMVNPAGPDPAEFRGPHSFNNRAEVRSFIESSVTHSIKQYLMYGVLVAIGLCCVPKGDGAAPKMSWLVRGLIFSMIVLVAKFFTGDQLGAFAAMARVVILGFIVLLVYWISSLFKKHGPVGKNPAHLAWSSDRRPQAKPDDPAMVDRLEHWRSVASQSPPAHS
jgi:hypothetical protein